MAGLTPLSEHEWPSDTCVICTLAYSENQSTVNLGCHFLHTFGKECINSWLNGKHSTCSVGRCELFQKDDSSNDEDSRDEYDYWSDTYGSEDEVVVC